LIFGKNLPFFHGGRETFHMASNDNFHQKPVENLVNGSSASIEDNCCRHLKKKLEDVKQNFLK
jgi:hypothetical protein